MRMHVDARPEPLCLPSAGYQPAELDLRRSLDSHLAASNVIVSLLQVRKSRLRMVGSTCPGIVQLVGDAERIQTQVRMTWRLLMCPHRESDGSEHTGIISILQWHNCAHLE